MSKDTQKVSVREKIGYGLGDTASNLFWQTFMMFLLFFYTDIFGIPAAVAGTMFLITRIWDTVNDPIMGVIADRTDTKWGKFRPWLLWLAIPFGLIGLLTFTTPNLGFTGKVIYAYITYTLMGMAYTAINIPYSALMGVMTPNSIERTSLSSYRFVFAFLGGLIVLGLTLPMVEHFGKGNESIVKASVSGKSINITETGRGTAKIILRAEDDKGAQSRHNFLVKVNEKGYNPPKAANPLNDLYVEKGFGLHEIELSDVFADPEGDTLKLTVTSDRPKVVKAKIKDGVLALREKGTGTATISVTADDRRTGTATDSFVVRVNAPGNRPPAVVNPLTETTMDKAFKSTSLDIGSVFSDPDGDKLTFSTSGYNSSVVSASVSGKSLNLNSRYVGSNDLITIVSQFFGMLPKEKAAGTTAVTITADDGKGGTVSTTFKLTIRGSGNNSPTVANPVGSVSVFEDFGSKTVDISTVFEDVDGDALRYSLEIVNEAKGYQRAMMVFGSLATVLFLITFVSTKERVSPSKEHKSTLGKDLLDLWANKPWITLFFIGIFTLTFVSVRNGSIIYYFKYYVGNETLATAFMVCGTLVTIPGVMLTKPLAKIFGKRMLYTMSMGIATFLILMFYFLDKESIGMMFALQVGICFVLGPTSPLVWAMYADTADYSEWKTGRRATGLVFSAATFSQKAGWTIGGTLAGWLLGYYGFRANVPASEETLFGIRMMMSFIPAVASFAAAGFMILYKLDEKTMNTIETELARRKGEALPGATPAGQQGNESANQDDGQTSRDETGQAESTS